MVVFLVKTFGFRDRSSGDAVRSVIVWRTRSHQVRYKDRYDLLEFVNKVKEMERSVGSRH